MGESYILGSRAAPFSVLNGAAHHLVDGARVASLGTSWIRQVTGKCNGLGGAGAESLATHFIERGNYFFPDDC